MTNGQTEKIVYTIPIVIQSGAFGIERAGFLKLGPQNYKSSARNVLIDHQTMEI